MTQINGSRNGRDGAPPGGEALRVLATLDPAAERPDYWDAFRARVMDRVALELARRRAAARESVASVLSGWSRGLIPVAAVAAAIAAVLVMTETRGGSDPAPQLVMRDILGDQAADRPFEPAFSDQAGSAAFMALVEGGRR